MCQISSFHTLQTNDNRVLLGICLAVALKKNKREKKQNEKMPLSCLYSVAERLLHSFTFPYCGWQNVYSRLVETHED